jgi:hypothetical protein
MTEIQWEILARLPLAGTADAREGDLAEDVLGNRSRVSTQHIRKCLEAIRAEGFGVVRKQLACSLTRDSFYAAQELLKNRKRGV